MNLFLRPGRARSPISTASFGLSVWRDDNGRADCENVIKKLQQGFALPTLCLESFWATEAALCLATLTYSLSVLFQLAVPIRERGGWSRRLEKILSPFPNCNAVGERPSFTA